ncbi:keratin-associated protein 5-1-like, partial [Ostrinia nubilalis]|uniref:keratin-associated protein 5-1-like n=1 Tax=Ostrinia nubilalis TaxID=29057 RepID=UPI0030826911
EGCVARSADHLVGCFVCARGCSRGGCDCAHGGCGCPRGGCGCPRGGCGCPRGGCGCPRGGCGCPRGGCGCPHGGCGSRRGPSVIPAPGEKFVFVPAPILVPVYASDGYDCASPSGCVCGCACDRHYEAAEKRCYACAPAALYFDDFEGGHGLGCPCRMEAGYALE